MCSGCDPALRGAQRCVRTSDDGSFSLLELPPMAYRVAASAPGFAPAFAAGGEPLSVNAGSTRDDLEIVLRHSGVELTGRVLDATGGPVPGARVRFVRWQTPPIVAHTQTDAEGKFAAFVSEGAVTLTASAEGYSDATLYRVAPSSDVELMLVPAASILGTVVTADQTQRPVAGAEVSAVAIGRAINSAVATTAADGSFVLSGLDPANYQLAAAAPGLRGNSTRLVPVALAQTVRGVQIAVAHGAQLSGRVVVMPERKPCLEGNVELGPRIPEEFAPPSLRVAMPPADPKRDSLATFTARIAAGGEVHFDALPPARYFAAVDCHGYQPSSTHVTVDVGTNDISDVVWEVEPGLALALRVIDRRGQVVPHEQITVTAPRLEGRAGRTDLFITDSEGNFETPAILDPGSYHIESFRHAAPALDLELKPGMGRVEATLRLSADAAIEIQAKNASGTPLDGLNVVAYAVGSRPAEGAHAGQPEASFPAVERGRGAYRLGSLSAGSYRVEITDGVNPPVEASTQLVEGQTRTIEVTLARQGQLSGYAYDSRGATIPDVWVSVISESARDKLDELTRRAMPPARRVLSDERGHFVVTGLDPSGSYTVSAEDASSNATGSISAARPGSEVKLELAPRLAQDFPSAAPVQYPNQPELDEEKSQ